MPGDVLIIGGGLIGSSIAWRLAQKGARVTLVDAGNLGGEASPAGAGMLSPAAEGGEQAAALALGLESLRLYPAFVEELRAETGLPIDFRITGCLVAGAADRTAHARAGIRVERKPEGLFYPDDGLVDPVQLLRALRCAAEARGVVVERRVEGAVESTEYGAVVVAAGAWSGSLAITHGGARVALPQSVPVKGHLIGFDMRPGWLGPFVRRGSTYVLQRADGFVIAGSNEEHAGFDTSVDAAVCEQIHREAAELAPELAGVEPVRRWTGLRPALASGAGPMMQRAGERNVWLAYGHYRNGILLTPVTAQRISASICG